MRSADYVQIAGWMELIAISADGRIALMLQSAPAVSSHIPAGLVLVKTNLPQ